MGWLKDLQLVCAKAACSVFGLDPSSDEAADFIRIAYQDLTTTAQAINDKDVVYVTLSAAQDNANPYYSVSYNEDGNADISFQIGMGCLYSCYGPNADQNAQKLRVGIMFDGGEGTPRAILRSAKLVPLRMPDPPITMPQIVDGLWRRRADVRLTLTYLRDESQPYRKIDPDTGIEIGVINS